MMKSLDKALRDYYTANIADQALAFCTIAGACKRGDDVTLRHYSAKLGIDVKEAITPYQLRAFDILAEGFERFAKLQKQDNQEVND